MALADAIVHQQVARQERGHDQSGPVAEPARGCELAHAGIDHRHPGATVAPCLHGDRVIRLVPEGGHERCVRDLLLPAPVEEVVVVELTPRELARKAVASTPDARAANSTCSGESVPKWRSAPRREVASPASPSRSDP